MTTTTRGFTLIETIIYITLFGLLMAGVVATTFQLTVGSETINSQIAIEEEVTFLLGKIEWVISGAMAADISIANPGPDAGTTLNVGGGAAILNFHNHSLELNGAPLNDDKISIDDLVFEKVALRGQMLIKTSLSVGGHRYSITKYPPP